VLEFPLLDLSLLRRIPARPHGLIAVVFNIGRLYRSALEAGYGPDGRRGHRRGLGFVGSIGPAVRPEMKRRHRQSPDADAAGRRLLPQAVHLRLSQPGAVEPPAGTRSGAQRRGDVAGWSSGAGSQDDCGLPQGQRRRDQEGVCVASLSCAGRWACYRKQALRSMAASSRP